MIVLGIVIMFFIVSAFGCTLYRAYKQTYGTRTVTNDWCYRLPFFLQMVPGFFLAVIIFFLPYSPRWLAGRGRDEECLRVLCRVRQLPPTDPRVQAEWIQIRAEATHNAEALIERHPTLVGDGFKMEFKRECASWIDMFKPAVIRRTFIGITLMVSPLRGPVDIADKSSSSNSSLESTRLSTTRLPCSKLLVSTTIFVSSCRV